MLIFGIILVVAILYLPEGLVGLIQGLWKRIPKTRYLEVLTGWEQKLWDPVAGAYNRYLSHGFTGLIKKLWKRMTSIYHF